MNIGAVNLNLLVAFDALFEELSVTRAARRAGVTQPAMSNTLAQLRRLFDDALFVRHRTGLTPTARAKALAEPIRKGLQLLEGALTGPSFDPATSDRRFVLATSDYVELVLLPALLRRLSEQAPGVQLALRPWGLHEAPPELARGEVDLMLGFYDKLPPHHHEQPLFHDEYVCVVRRRHPTVKSKLTLAQYLRLSHVLVSARSDSLGSVDRALLALGKKRRIGARVSHFLTVPVLVSLFCFCNVNMKSKDNYFVGFPAAWNVVVVYLYLLDFEPWVTFAVIMVLAGLTLTRMKFLHPFRVKQFMPINIAVTMVWMFACAGLIMQFPAQPVWLLVLWGLSSAYFVGMCVWRSAREWFA